MKSIKEIEREEDVMEIYKGLHLRKNRSLKGPEHFGCINTGLRPKILHYHSDLTDPETELYVVGPETLVVEALFAHLSAKCRTVYKNHYDRRCWIYNSRQSAMKRFVGLVWDVIKFNKEELARAEEARKTIKENPTNYDRNVMEVLMDGYL